MIRSFDKFRSFLTEKVPRLDKKGFYAGPFYLGESEGVKRLVINYQNSQVSRHEECFLYLIENFPSEKIESINLSDLEKEKWEERKILKGYKPGFEFGRNLLQNVGKRITWKERNELHSLFLCQNSSQERLNKYLQLILSSEEALPEMDLFDLLSHLPKEVSGLSLESVFLWLQGVRGNNDKHQINHLQGNYKLEGGERTLNLELRFGCQDKGVQDSLKEIPDESVLQDETEVKIDGRNLKLRTIQNFKDQPEVKAFFWTDQENAYTLIVHNNQTTEFKNFQEQMRNLVRAGLKSLEDYSLLERIAGRKLPEEI